MSFAPRILTVDFLYHDQRLDNFLFTRLKGVPKTCIYRLLRQGKIRANKKRCKPHYRVRENDIIRLPQLNMSESTTPSLNISPARQQELLKAVLFENEGFFIINKPYGLAVHGGSGISLGLIESLRQIYPTVPLSLVHRLDRDTSGCLIIAKKPSYLKSLHALFREKKIKKTYLMLIQGHWPKKMTYIDQPLLKNRLQSGERMVKVNSEGQEALTQYAVCQYFKTSSLIKAIPHTGRTHQLRVHAQFAKHPIGGDEKYGDKHFNQSLHSKGLRRLFLHAYQLEFTCPQTQAHIKVTAPLPASLAAMLKQDI